MIDVTEYWNLLNFHILHSLKPSSYPIHKEIQRTWYRPIELKIYSKQNIPISLASTLLRVKIIEIELGAASHLYKSPPSDVLCSSTESITVKRSNFRISNSIQQYIYVVEFCWNIKRSWINEYRDAVHFPGGCSYIYTASFNDKGAILIKFQDAVVLS